MIDTKAKRFSMLSAGVPGISITVPTGTQDRQTLLDRYNGISFAGIPQAVVSAGHIVLIKFIDRIVRMDH